MDTDGWIEIAAPIEQVNTVACDLERCPEWQPEITHAECLERDQNGRVTGLHIEIETAIGRTEADLRFTYSEPNEISWVMERGDIRRFEGSWTLVELEDGRTGAAYAVTIDLGPALGLLLFGLAGKALEDAVANSMPAKLKAYVETRARALLAET